MSEDAGCADRFLCVPLATVTKPISDLRLLTSGLYSLPFALNLVSALLLALSLAGAMLFALCAFAQAQQPKKIPRIGYVSGTGDNTNPGPYLEALRQGLKAYGYVDGQNIAIEYRGAGGELGRTRGFIDELIGLKVDVLVLPTPETIRAAKQATKTIPIVMVTGGDPVANGFINSLAHPGGNITGLYTQSVELTGKRLELLKEVVPRLTRVALLRNPNTAPATAVFKEYDTAAKALKLQLHSLDVGSDKPDLPSAFQAAVKARAQAIVTVTNAQFLIQQARIVDLAVKHRLPSVFQSSPWVEAGGLMSYSTNEIDVFGRAASYVHKILNGAKPADLPVEQPTKFEFVINLKTAKALNLTIPQSVLFRADRVIR
jgi:putative tryptophan/tyrosine transport system substrate-binding protein